MEPMFGAPYAGSDRGAGANAGAQGNFVQKLPGSALGASDPRL